MSQASQSLAAKQRWSLEKPQDAIALARDKLKDAWDHVVLRHGVKADDGVASSQWTHANSFTILGFIKIAFAFVGCGRGAMAGVRSWARGERASS